MKVACSNCGTMGEEDAMRCTNCGTTLEYNDMPDPNNPKAADDKSSNKAVIAVAIIATVAIAIVGVVIACISFISSNSYKSVIEDKLYAIQTLDVEKIADTYPEFMYNSQSDFGYRTYDDLVRSIEKYQLVYMKDLLSKLEKKVGDNVELSYEIEKINNLTDIKQQKFCDAIEENFGYNLKNISVIKKADIIVKAKGSDDTYEFEWEDVYLFKQDGKWYLLNVDLENGSMGKKGDYHVDFYQFYRAGTR